MRYLKMNIRKVVVAMLLICFVCVGTLTTKILASDEYIVNSNVNAMMSEINTMIDNQDTAMQSSNPYDYIQNEHFYNIVERGIGALPVLTSELDSSSENGLREYILAIAVEEITNTNMNDDTVNCIKIKYYKRQVTLIYLTDFYNSLHFELPRSPYLLEPLHAYKSELNI